MKPFLFGAVYIIEQDYTEEEIHRDLQYMKECGYNLVTLWPVANAWVTDNSHEWVFSETKKVLDQCQMLGMKAILQLFGQNQAQEFMPDSALTEEMEIHDERGEHINENCFWANLNHPVVRDYMDRYFKAAIETFKDHPAVFGYDVFNEAHFRSDDEYTKKKYQEWLKEKYQTIENLNHIWYRRYDSFSQISPTKRRSAYSIWSSIMPDLEYEKFRSVNLTEICQFLYETAKKYDSMHPIIIDGTSAHIIAGDVTLRNNDEIATAAIPDIYGSTFYPKSWGKNYRDTPWTMSMYYSIPAGAAKCAGKPYIVNELQTHTQSVLTPGSEVSPQELYDWILMCIFTGTQGMQLWRWRPFLHGYQSTGRGLTAMDGIPNERSERVRELVSFIHKNGELFDEFKVKESGVKIAVSYSARLYFDVFLKWGQSFWKENLEGWYKLFWDNGLNPEFADLENLQDENAKVLVLPSILSVGKTTAEQLKHYVENGGILIADGRLGSVDEYGCVPAERIPGEALSQLFGIKETDVDSGHSFRIGYGEDSHIILCGYMEQKLEIAEDAEILGWMDDGTPAVVLHPFGKGWTLYFNSFVGMTMLKHGDKELSDLVIQVLQKTHCNFMTADKSDKVHVSWIQTESHLAALVINFAEESEVISLHGLKKECSLVNLMTGEEISAGEEAVLNVPGNTAYVYKI